MVYSVGANTGFLYVKCDYQTKVGKIYGMDWSSHFKTEGLCLALSTFPPCFPFTWLRKACSKQIFNKKVNVIFGNFLS
jgi:hypothetical protein